MPFADIVSKIVHFQEVTHKSLQARFAKLATGQSPDTLFIGCADSRLVPSLLTASGPGDLFVTRNPGNFVPPSDPQIPAEATLASLEYAVRALTVKNIIVCGHSDCGAMKALQAGGAKELPYVAAWLRHSEGLTAKDKNLDLPSLTKRNIIRQLRHLRSHAFVAEREAASKLTLHGWYYDIGEGRIDVLDEQSGEFECVTQPNT